MLFMKQKLNIYLKKIHLRNFFFLLKILFKILISPFFFLCLIIMYFFKIRLYKQHYFLGATVYLETYLQEKKNNKHNKYIDFFSFDIPYKVIFISSKKYNKFFLKLIFKRINSIKLNNKYVLLLYCLIINYLIYCIDIFKLSSFLVPIHENIKFSSKYNYEYSNKNNLQNFPPLKLSQKEYKIIENHTKELIKHIDLNSRDLITFCNRDSSYKKYQIGKTINSDYHDFRNFSINDMISSINFLLSENNNLIRLGNMTNEKLSIDNKLYLDYSQSNFINEYSDIYLIYKSKFFISTLSGLDKVASFFGKPIVFINLQHLLNFPTFINDCFFIIQKIYDLKNKRYLTLTEMVDPNLNKSMVTNLPVGLYTRTDDYEDNNYKVINNSPEEILNVVKEMNSYLNNNLILSNDDQKRQELFWNIMYKAGQKKQKTFFISPYFLKQNKFLLD